MYYFEIDVMSITSVCISLSIFIEEKFFLFWLNLTAKVVPVEMLDDTRRSLSSFLLTSSMCHYAVLNGNNHGP